MKKGDSVMIFEDYLTKKRGEGKARLVKPIRVPTLERWDGKDIEVHYWEVVFESDNFKTERFFTTEV